MNYCNSATCQLSSLWFFFFSKYAMYSACINMDDGTRKRASTPHHKPQRIALWLYNNSSQVWQYNNSWTWKTEQNNNCKMIEIHYNISYCYCLHKFFSIPNNWTWKTEQNKNCKMIGIHYNIYKYCYCLHKFFSIPTIVTLHWATIQKKNIFTNYL